jgi:hypothetical protein
MSETVHIILQIALAAALTATGIAVVVWTARSLLLPLPKSRELELYTLVTASGGGRELEQLINGLHCLSDFGALPGQIVIADCGLDADGRKTAELITRDNGSLTLCTLAELSEILEERAWTRGKLTYR